MVYFNPIPGGGGGGWGGEGEYPFSCTFLQSQQYDFCRFSGTWMIQKYYTLREVTTLAHINVQPEIFKRFLWIAVAVVLPRASLRAAALGCHPITICLSQLTSLWPST